MSKRPKVGKRAKCIHCGKAEPISVMKKVYVRVEIPTKRKAGRVHTWMWINAYVCRAVVEVYEELAQVNYHANRRRR